MSAVVDGRIMFSVWQDVTVSFRQRLSLHIQ